MSTLYLDFETYSSVPIEFGTDAYMSGVKPLILCWAVDDGPVHCEDLDFGDGFVAWSAGFLVAFESARRIVAHNATFDRAVLASLKLTRPASAWHCTMQQAYAHGLPGSLDALCRLYKVNNLKRDGRPLIRLFCIPDKNGQRTRLRDEPERAKEFREYASIDVAALREVHRALPTWNEDVERPVRIADIRINERGVGVDVDLAERVARMLDADQAAANARMFELTNGYADGTSDRTGLLYWLRDQGIGTVVLDSATIEDILATRPDLSPEARQVLELRLEYGQSSVKKFGVINRAQVGGRLRHTLQYCGAMRTGRWSGRTFQPQNLPRPKRKAEEIERAIDNLKCGRLGEENLIGWAADMVRSTLVAAPGKQLVVADLSNIEGRILAWVAGEEWKLEAFRAYDRGEGPDIYVASYAQAFGVPVDQVTKQQRQIGKVMELALGYQGSVGAFATMAAGYGVNLGDLADMVLEVNGRERLLRQYENAYDFYLNSVSAPMPRETYAGVRFLVDRWRGAHPATVRLWRDVQSAVQDVCEGRRGTVVQVRNMSVDKVGTCVRLRLPSQRYLCYHLLQCNPRTGALECPLPHTLGSGYARYGSEKTKAEPAHLYGGKLVENICQAVARDVLAAALVDLDRPGAPAQVVMHVHDEVIVETFPGAFGVEHLVMDLTRERPWSEGLPLAAAGFTCTRYRKE